MNQNTPHDNGAYQVDDTQPVERAATPNVVGYFAGTIYDDHTVSWELMPHDENPRFSDGAQPVHKSMRYLTIFVVRAIIRFLAKGGVE